MTQVSPLAHYSSITGLVTRHAAERPDAIAFAQLKAGQPAETTTYMQLDIRVRQIAAELHNIGVRRGDRIILLFPSSLEFIASFLACQWIGAIPAPAYPPQKDDATIRRIIENCGASWVLASPVINSRVIAKFLCFGMSSDQIVSIDANFGSQTGDVPPAQHEIALLQYTSGSTSAPKGVVLSHQNLLANVHAITSHMGAVAGEAAVSWLPMYHDMGLIGMVLGSLYSGVSLYFMAPAEFVRNPTLWLEAIGSTGAAYSGGPNFAYQHCVDRIGPTAIDRLDLSTWRVATNGAEPVKNSVLEGFCEKFAPSGFRRKAFLPCYGLAESSLMVTGVNAADHPTVRYVDRVGMDHGKVVFKNRSAQGTYSYVSCGGVIPDHHLAIVDPASGERLPENRCGEIWIAGPSVTSGYWPLADASLTDSSQLFADLLQENGTGKTYLRTGDLGFLSDGQLFVTGRMKDLIIVRGLNYHPQDIEEAAWCSQDAIEPNGCIAFQAGGSDQADIVLLIEIRREWVRKIDAGEIVSAVRTTLATEFQLSGIAVGLVSTRALPRTSSGKVRRSHAQAMYAEGLFEFLALDNEAGGSRRVQPDAAHEAAAQPLSDTENWLLELVARNLKINRDLVRCDAPIIEMGIDSLSQLNLTHEISAKYGLELEVEHYFDGITIRGLSQLINKVKVPA